MRFESIIILRSLISHYHSSLQARPRVPWAAPLSGITHAGARCSVRISSTVRNKFHNPNGKENQENENAGHHWRGPHHRHTQAVAIQQPSAQTQQPPQGRRVALKLGRQHRSLPTFYEHGVAMQVV